MRIKYRLLLRYIVMNTKQCLPHLTIILIGTLYTIQYTLLYTYSIWYAIWVRGLKHDSGV